MASIRPSNKRSLDEGSDDTDSEPGSDHAAAYPKLSKADPITSTTTLTPLSCSLPPHCHLNPPSFTSSAALESHYNKHHAHVCSECSKVFPDERFLDLHIREFHDPLVAVQRDNGKKTYVCFSPACGRKFSTPKKRRLHLIDLHKYPKEFFFALPMYGLESLYARFGDSASLIGPPRKAASETGSRETSPASLFPQPGSPSPDAVDQIHTTSTCVEPSGRTGGNPPIETDAGPPPVQEPDELAAAVSQLSLVPNSIRFGRGRGRGRTTATQRAAQSTAKLGNS